MARTKTTRKSEHPLKKVATPAEKKRIEVEVHDAPEWGSDIDSADADRIAIQCLTTPTVTLEDISSRKSTPKLSATSSCHTPVNERGSESEESAMLATPKSSRKSMPPNSGSVGSVDQSLAKRRKRCETYLFTDEQEADLSEWYQHHPMFYEKGDKDYKNGEKKKCLLEEKGMTMHPKCTCK